MAEVNCEVEHLELPNDDDNLVPSTRVTCTKCGHVTESFGQRGRSLRRCLALMGEECPGDAKNYYTTEEVVDED